MMNSALPASLMTQPAVAPTGRNVEKPGEGFDLNSFSDTLEQQGMSRDSDGAVSDSAVESLPTEEGDELQAGGPPDEAGGNSLPVSAETLPVEPSSIIEVSPQNQLGLVAQPQGLQAVTASGLKANNKPTLADNGHAAVNLVGTGKSVGPLDTAVGQARSASGALNDPLAIGEMAPIRSSQLVEAAQQPFAEALDEQGANVVGVTRAKSMALSTALLGAGSTVSASPGAINLAAENNSAVLTKMELPMVEMPPSSPRWGGAIAQRAQIAILQGVQQAEIRLTPAYLGTIEMHIQMQDERASVTMISPHASVREMLETATPKLRELLEQQGMTLQQNLVSDHSSDQTKSGHRDNSNLAPGVGNDDSEEQIVSHHPRVSAGLVDHYA